MNRLNQYLLAELTPTKPILQSNPEEANDPLAYWNSLYFLQPDLA